MQLGDFSCCAYIWALISSLYCTLTLPTILCNAQLSHWIVISLCDFNTLVSVLWVYIYGTNLYLCVLAAELSLNAEVTELLNECERPDLVQSLLLPEDLALRHLPALGVAHRRLDFSRRNSSLSPLQEVQALRLIHAHQIKCRLKAHKEIVCLWFIVLSWVNTEILVILRKRWHMWKNGVDIFGPDSKQQSYKEKFKIGCCKGTKFRQYEKSRIVSVKPANESTT